MIGVRMCCYYKIKLFYSLLSYITYNLFGMIIPDKMPNSK